MFLLCFPNGCISGGTYVPWRITRHPSRRRSPYCVAITVRNGHSASSSASVSILPSRHVRCSFNCCCQDQYTDKQLDKLSHAANYGLSQIGPSPSSRAVRDTRCLEKVWCSLPTSAPWRERKTESTTKSQTRTWQRVKAAFRLNHDCRGAGSRNGEASSTKRPYDGIRSGGQDGVKWRVRKVVRLKMGKSVGFGFVCGSPAAAVGLESVPIFFIAVPCLVVGKIF